MPRPRRSAAFRPALASCASRSASPSLRHASAPRSVRRHRSSSRRSNDLEIAAQLPIRDVAAAFALLPFARRRVMLDEIVAEEGARRLRGLEALRRIPQGRRQGKLCRMLLLIGVTFDRRQRLELLLDAPEA